MGRFIDLCGQTINGIKVLSRAPDKSSIKGQRKRPQFYCECLCGRTWDVDSTNLRRGLSKSCGKCHRPPELLDVFTTSRKPRTPELAAAHRWFQGLKNDALQRGHLFELTPEDAYAIAKKACFYCGGHDTKSGAATSYVSRCKKYDRKINSEYLESLVIKLNSLDRVDNSTGYQLDNVVSCCKICNFAKRDLQQSEFIAWIHQAAAHLSK